VAPQTLLAFDYGTKSIGVAAGQTVTKTATELPVLKARDGIPDWNEVEKLINEWQPGLVVVGLPLNMDESDSEFGARAKKFANRLHGRFGVAVELMDERLSTFDAKQVAMERGQTLDFAKYPVDSIAARLILESWFNQKD